MVEAFQHHVQMRSSNGICQYFQVVLEGILGNQINGLYEVLGVINIEELSFPSEYTW